MEPATKDITQAVIRPGGEALSKDAVPATEAVARGRIEPVVDAVSAVPLYPSGSNSHRTPFMGLYAW